VGEATLAIGQAIARGETVCTNEAAGERAFTGWRELAAERIRAMRSSLRRRWRGTPPSPDCLMSKTWLAVAVTFGFSVVGVIGDYFLKRASGQDRPLTSKWFHLGFLVYASTAFGWVFVMRHLKLATIGVVYSVSMVLLLTAVGATFFHESLNHYEVAGIVLALASLVLLVRFG
jgi:drug/metabolite transporter (DMT)-like permease